MDRPTFKWAAWHFSKTIWYLEKYLGIIQYLIYWQTEKGYGIQIPLLTTSGVVTLRPIGALAPPSASVAPLSILTYHVHSVHSYIHTHILCLYLYINCKYLAVKVHPLVSLAVGL